MFSPSNLAEVLGKINDGICVFNELGDAVFVNERAAQLLDEMDDEFRQKIKIGFIDQSSRRFEHFHTGLSRWFEHQTYPNPDGNFILISRDSTSRCVVGSSRTRRLGPARTIFARASRVFSPPLRVPTC